MDEPKLSCSGAVALLLLGMIASIGLFFMSYFIASAMMAG